MKRKLLSICCIALFLSAAGCEATSNPGSTDTESAGTEAAAAQAETVSAAAMTEETGKEPDVAEITAPITEDTKYHAVAVLISPEEFQAAGFELGDSCDITFSNGYSLEDVPFYNGYYVKDAQPVLVAYPGFDVISVTLNNKGLWDTAGAAENDTVTIRLNQAGKYSAIQDSLGQVYSFDRADYADDVQFCNFRALTGGNLKENYFYRGASPVDNSRGRASYTDALLKTNGVRFILDLADSQDDMEGYLQDEDFASPYADSLYKSGNTALLAMGSAFRSEDYCKKLVTGLRQMMASEGPVYIHCMEGKDRTGFVCMVLEALADADYDEMKKDYMLTYRNYYGITEEATPEKYEAIVDLYFNSFCSYFLGTEDKDELKSASYSDSAADYLRSGGMTDAELEQLRGYLCKQTGA